MSRIIELGEASSASMSDYLMLSSPTLGERKIKVSNLIGVSGLTTISMADYAQLTPQEIANGDYYIPDYEEITVNDFPYFGTATVKNESAMSVNDSSQNKTVSSIWDGRQFIGCDIRYKSPLDLTNINKITFDLTLGTCFGNGAQAQQQQWYYTVALVTDLYINKTDYFRGTDTSQFETYKQYSYSGRTYNNQSMNVSNLTGEHYLIIASHGWNSTLSNVKIKSGYTGQAISKHGDIFIPIV